MGFVKGQFLKPNNISGFEDILKSYKWSRKIRKKGVLIGKKI